MLLELGAYTMGKPEVQLTRRDPMKFDLNGTLINLKAQYTVNANLEAFAKYVKMIQAGKLAVGA